MTLLLLLLLKTSKSRNSHEVEDDDDDKNKTQPWLFCVVRDEQELLENKLSAIQKKIIVGGENLLEKAEEQERMLEESAKELEERKRKEDELRKQLEEKEVGRGWEWKGMEVW